MKRSRASLLLFLATLVFALHIVGPAGSPRAATADLRPLRRLCTADWSPLRDCYAGAPAPGMALAANNIASVSSTALDACHPEALPCSYQSHADYVHGVDCFGAPRATLCAHQAEDALPIEEFIYGDSAGQSADTAAPAPRAVAAHDEDFDACVDDFDCGLVQQAKIHREDITAVTDNKQHSTGLQTALEINANNDGLNEAKLPSIREAVAPPIAANAGANYDYGDCNFGDCEYGYCEYDYGCHGGESANVCDVDADEACEDLCGIGHCLAAKTAETRVVTSDEEPLDLPPAESAEIGASEYGYEDYEYGYEDDYSYDASSLSDESLTAEEDYGYGHNDEDLYVYEDDAAEPNDLPPAEQIIDDLPPGEQLSDDMPPGEDLPSAHLAYDPYDVECYGDYADIRPAAPKAWIEPGCDEQQSFQAKAYSPSEEASADDDRAPELTDDQRSWGIGSEYPAPPAFGDTAESQALLRSTARLLNDMGEALVSLSKSLADLTETDAASQPHIALPAGTFYPWPATLGRHQEIDAPLGL